MQFELRFKAKNENVKYTTLLACNISKYPIQTTFNVSLTNKYLERRNTYNINLIKSKQEDTSYC